GGASSAHPRDGGSNARAVPEPGARSGRRDRGDFRWALVLAAGVRARRPGPLGHGRRWGSHSGPRPRRSDRLDPGARAPPREGYRDLRARGGSVGGGGTSRVWKGRPVIPTRVVPVRLLCSVGAWCLVGGVACSRSPVARLPEVSVPLEFGSSSEEKEKEEAELRGEKGESEEGSGPEAKADRAVSG